LPEACLTGPETGREEVIQDSCRCHNDSLTRPSVIPAFAGMTEGMSRRKMAKGLPRPGLAWQDLLATGALILCVISTTSWMPLPGQRQGHAFPLRFV